MVTLDRLTTTARTVLDDPAHLVVAVTTVAVTLAVHLGVWLLPAYLDALGVGPVAIGVAASLLAVARLAGRARVVDWEELAPPTLLTANRIVAFGGLLVAGGAFLWLLAPQTAVSTVLVVVGWIVATAAWTRLGPTREREGDEWTGGGTRTALVLVAPALVVLFDNVAPAVGFQVFGALVAALAATAAAVVVLGGVRTDPWAPLDRATAAVSRHTPASLPSPTALTRVPAALGAGSTGRRALLAGDAALTVCAAMVQAVLALVVLDVHGVGVGVAGPRTAALAFFVLLLAVEAKVGVVAATLGSLLADRLGPWPVLVGGALATATFPLAFVRAPSLSLVLVPLAGLYGLRAAGWRVRDRVRMEPGPGPNQDPDRESEGGGPTSRRVRGHAAVAGGVVAGVCYALSPSLAFGVASCLGLVGVWQYLRAYRVSRAN